MYDVSVSGSFVHLHNHSMASLLDGFSTPQEIAERAAELEQPAIAITDHGSMAGTIAFYEACRAVGIKPLFGIEAYVCSDMESRDKESKIYHAVFIARNEIGLKKLYKISESSWTRGFYKKPRVDAQCLNDICAGEGSSEDVIWLTGCIDGILSHAVSAGGDDDEASRLLGDLSDIFRYKFAEIQPWNPPDLNDAIYSAASKLGIDTVVTIDAHYPSPKDKDAAEVALLLSQFSSMKKSDRDVAESRSGRLSAMPIIERLDALWPHRKLSFAKYQNHIASYDEVVKFMEGRYVDSIDRTVSIADMCDDIDITFGQDHLPRFDKRVDSDTLLSEIAYENLSKMGLNDERYKERLQEELFVVTRLGFANYFLIIWDMVHACRTNGIMVGPGRGSVGGSLLAYVLGITEIDPIKFNLTFWRFLNIDFDYNPIFSVIDDGRSL